MNYLRELWGTRELLANLTMRDVKGKYRRTILGQLWSLIYPLAMMVVYTIVFAVLFRAQPPAGNPSGLNAYPLWLVCGLIPWTFFTHTVTGCMTSVVHSASLVKKVYFPRINLPLAEVGSAGFTFLNELAILVVVVLLFGGWSLPWIPLLLVFTLLLGLFGCGVGMLLAILNVHFRDTEHFVAIALRLGQYLTPVVYPITIVQALGRSKGHWVVDIFELNPMAHFVEVFRNLLYDNRWPTVGDSLWCLGAAVITFAIGAIVFVRNERGLVRYL